MQNKPKNRWLDIQIVVASLAITGSLALWNAFAKSNPVKAGSANPPPADPTFTFTYVPTQAPTATSLPGASVVHLPKVYMLMGGKPPVVRVVVAGSSSAGGTGFPKGSGAMASGNGSGGSTASSSGSGGGTSSSVSNPGPAPVPAPPPVTTTSSSKP